MKITIEDRVFPKGTDFQCIRDHSARYDIWTCSEIKVDESGRFDATANEVEFRGYDLNRKMFESFWDLVCREKIVFYKEDFLNFFRHFKEGTYEICE